MLDSFAEFISIKIRGFYENNFVFTKFNALFYRSDGAVFYRNQESVFRVNTILGGRSFGEGDVIRRGGLAIDTLR